MPDTTPGRTSPSPATLLALCCAFGFASYVSSYMRIPVVPLFAASLGANAGEVGLINAAFLLTTGLLSFPFGLVSDRWGRKPVVTAGLAVSAATAFLLCVTRTPGQLLAIYLAFGAGLAAIGPTLMSYVADVSPSGYLGRAYGWYTMAIYSAMSVGPAIGGSWAEGLGFTSLFMASGGFVALIALLAFFILPELRLASNPPHKAGHFISLLRDLLRNRRLLGCWLATLAGCFGMGMYMTFIPLYAHNRSLTLARIGLLFMVQAAANALSRIPLGHLCDRQGRRVRLTTLGLLAMALCLAAFALARTTLHFISLSVLLGISMGLTFTPLGALIADVVAPERRGLAMGGYNTCIYLGMMLSSAFMGHAIDALDFPASFVATAIVLAALTPLFVRLMQRQA